VNNLNFEKNIMLTKNQIKLYASLQQKKYRNENKLFVAEGKKIVNEAIESNFKIHSIITTSEWCKNNFEKTNIEIVETSQNEINKISSLATPTEVLAIIEIPEIEFIDLEIENNLTIILDNINDPGNLGTIIRLADWFGIQNIICSQNSVDQFNSKVVQASMGSIFRTKIHYTNLLELLKKFSQKKDFNIYGTFLEGENIYNQKLNNQAFIIFGSESHGISENLKPFIFNKLNIPSYNSSKTESLNISIATAIVCSEFRKLI